MRKLRSSLFLRYTLSVTLVALIIAIMLAVEFRSDMSETVAFLVALVALLVLLGGVTVWTQRTLSSDLKELSRAFERLMLEGELDRMPQPRLSELNDLAQEMDEFAVRLREDYSQLARERDRLKAVLDNISAGVIVVNRRLKIDLINPVAEKLLGTTREYALGRTFTEIHHSPVIDRAIERSRRGAVVNKEIQITLPHRRWLRVLASPIKSPRGRTTGVICVIEDITSRRKLERVRRDFVANVSHELRTPVANMRAVVEALLAGAREEPEASARFMADLDRESKRLADIIEDLLVLSKLETSGAEVEVERFRLDEVIREAISEKEDLARRYEVELVLEDPVPETVITGDRSLLKTACANLLDNAVKYNRPGGRVDVSLERGEASSMVRVTDNGIGIPPSDREKVFERFYRVDKARSRDTGGTGLGLSIVKHAAESHGGSVNVSSSEGRGSTFTLTLPT
jgi:two-component system, OmpR family, phosphate regulon sensor histidine kinase PhoR